jgi:hypothetical protein
VKVVHTNEDQVGQSVAFNLKEAIRGSQSFFLVEEIKKPTITVLLVSIDISVNEPKKGVSSANSEVVVYDSLTTPGNGILLYSNVAHCGSNKVEQCAKSILPSMDRAVQDLRANWPDLWKQLSQ